MPARSVVVQLQAGIGQATLPDHRKMLPGVQYVIDWETFEKISRGARQNVIQVVTINTDSTTASGSFVPAQISTNFNTQLSLQSALYTVSPTPIAYDVAGFAAQGFDGIGGVGVGPSVTGGTINNSLTGPAGERYTYVYNPSASISGTQVVVWFDESNRFVTNARPTYQVIVDAQGTEYVASSDDYTTSPTTVGTRQGGFAGVALVTIPSGNYGWIQTEGICPAVSAVSGVTAGATLAVGGVGVAVAQAAGNVVITGTTVSGSALSNNVFGTALTTASGANQSVQADLRSAKRKKPYQRFLNKN